MPLPQEPKGRKLHEVVRSGRTQPQRIARGAQAVDIVVGSGSRTEHQELITVGIPEPAGDRPPSTADVAHDRLRRDTRHPPSGRRRIPGRLQLRCRYRSLVAGPIARRHPALVQGRRRLVVPGRPTGGRALPRLGHHGVGRLREDERRPDPLAAGGRRAVGHFVGQDHGDPETTSALGVGVGVGVGLQTRRVPQRALEQVVGDRDQKSPTLDPPEQGNRAGGVLERVGHQLDDHGQDIVVGRYPCGRAHVAGVKPGRPG
jgi:hypothetical protein